MKDFICDKLIISNETNAIQYYLAINFVQLLRKGVLKKNEVMRISHHPIFYLYQNIDNKFCLHWSLSYRSTFTRTPSE